MERLTRHDRSSCHPRAEPRHARAQRTHVDGAVAVGRSTVAAAFDRAPGSAGSAPVRIDTSAGARTDRSVPRQRGPLGLPYSLPSRNRTGAAVPFAAGYSRTARAALAIG